MARKRLMKGANALRVEERIAKVPADLVGNGEGESGIFEALKALEREAGAAGPAPRPVAERSAARDARPVAAARDARPVAAARDARPVAARPEPAANAEPKAAGRTPPGTPARLGPLSFTPEERRAIVVCCTEYRNRLPTYLQSARREVELLDSILRKCARVERDAERGAERE